MNVTIKNYYQEIKEHKSWVLTYTQEAKLQGKWIPTYTEEINRKNYG